MQFTKSIILQKQAMNINRRLGKYQSRVTWNHLMAFNDLLFNSVNPYEKARYGPMVECYLYPFKED